MTTPAARTKRFAMIREFHLADWVTLGNAVCGTGALFSMLTYLQEGAVQSFHIPDSVQRVPLLGAVGPLQYEVLQYRLESEYGATTRLEPAPWGILRWIDPVGAPVTPEMLPSSCRLARDSLERPVALFSAEWELKFFVEKNPKVLLHKLPSGLSA